MQKISTLDCNIFDSSGERVVFAGWCEESTNKRCPYPSDWKQKERVWPDFLQGWPCSLTWIAEDEQGGKEKS
jgi:hypothetical protein